MDFARFMEPIARALLGEPNAHLSDLKKGELRYHNHGSLVINLKKGTWYDHEAGEGGGVLDLITREKGITDSAERIREAKELAGITNDQPGGGLGIIVATSTTPMRPARSCFRSCASSQRRSASASRTRRSPTVGRGTSRACGRCLTGCPS